MYAHTHTSTHSPTHPPTHRRLPSVCSSWAEIPSEIMFFQSRQWRWCSTAIFVFWKVLHIVTKPIVTSFCKYNIALRFSFLLRLRANWPAPCSVVWLHVWGHQEPRAALRKLRQYRLCTQRASEVWISGPGPYGATLAGIKYKFIHMLIYNIYMYVCMLYVCVYIYYVPICPPMFSRCDFFTKISKVCCFVREALQACKAPLANGRNVCVCVCMYTYMYTYMHMHIYLFMYMYIHV